MTKSFFSSGQPFLGFYSGQVKHKNNNTIKRFYRQILDIKSYTIKSINHDKLVLIL